MINLFGKAIDKIKMVSLDSLQFDPDFKEVFTQEKSKVDRIVADIKCNGFDKSQPIIITSDYSILDGNSRFLAAKEAGIKTVPVIIKHFDNKEDALIYEYNLQLNRRNLSDAESFTAFQKLDELRNKTGTKSYTDDKIAEQLNKSPRQISKMREVSKKASSEVLKGLKDGSLSLNKAYTQMKYSRNAKIDTAVQKIKKSPATKKNNKN